jgi:DNA-binding transcriptional MerR regulator/methylmalonyl-CoA mutase cobalamin-binding subunit
MFDHYSNEPVFNVKAMAHQTGVAAATLRAWERRYGVPTPPRTDSGYRLYSARDVAIIRWLRSQIENGMSISQAVHLLRTVETQSVNGTEPAARTVTTTLPSSHQRLHDMIVVAASEFDEDQIERALSEAFSIFPVEEVCLSLIQPVLVTLGDRWHTGQINVSVEHFVTNIMRRKMLALMASSPIPSRDARIVSACAPEEYHEIGILMISLFLRRSGYNVIYLGQSISALRLEEMLAKTQPNLLLISAGGLIPAANLLDVVEAIRARASHNGLVLAFGGRIFGQMPQLQARVPGLYIGDDAQQATGRIMDLLASTQDAPFNAPHAPADPAQSLSQTLTAFRLHRPEIVAAATRLAQAEFAESLDYKRTAEANDNLLRIVDAALRFNEPAIVGDSANWKWDALPPDGISMPQLQRCVLALTQATRTVMDEHNLSKLEPFLSALEGSLVQQL